MAVNICNMEEKDRIEKIMREENMTLSQFSLEIGVQQSTLSHILSGRNKMSAAVMKQILKRFPTISSDWILLGDGPNFTVDKKLYERLCRCLLAINNKATKLEENIKEWQSFPIIVKFDALIEYINS